MSNGAHPSSYMNATTSTSAPSGSANQPFRTVSSDKSGRVTLTAYLNAPSTKPVASYKTPLPTSLDESICACVYPRPAGWSNLGVVPLTTPALTRAASGRTPRGRPSTARQLRLPRCPTPPRAGVPTSIAAPPRALRLVGAWRVTPGDREHPRRDGVRASRRRRRQHVRPAARPVTARPVTARVGRVEHPTELTGDERVVHGIARGVANFTDCVKNPRTQRARELPGSSRRRDGAGGEGFQLDEHAGLCRRRRSVCS